MARSKKLLLVDDEKFLLESLKEGLSDYSHLFETEICFSVDEAIERTKVFRFDLVITDIRMPGKSGIDLLMYLKTNYFQGKVMAMTAYGDEEVFSKISELGGMKVIVKPFDFEWFKRMLIDFFEEKKGFSGTIDSIDLTSVLQIINLEKKSVDVKITIDDKDGFLHFDKGEIINAEFDGVTGEDAAKNLINLNKGKFVVLKSRKEVNREITTPFITFIIDVATEIDEQKYNIIKPKEPEKKLNIGVSQEIFKPIASITGFKSAGVFNSDGYLISEQTARKVNIRELGIFGLNLYETFIDTFKRMGLGRFELFQVHTDKLIFIFTWLIQDEAFMGMVLGAGGNVGIIKHKLKEITKEIDKYVVL